MQRFPIWTSAGRRAAGDGPGRPRSPAGRSGPGGRGAGGPRGRRRRPPGQPWPAGPDRRIDFSSGALDHAGLAAHAEDLARIGRALGPDADLLLWSCDTGAAKAGRDFIDALARATGAQVAAATHRVGAEARGGGWTLDAATGPVRAAAPFTDHALAAYEGVLVEPNLYFAAIGTGNSGPDLFRLSPGGAPPLSIPVRTDPSASFGSYAGEGGGFHQLGGNLYFFADTGPEIGALFQLAPNGTLTEITGATSTGEDAHFTYVDNNLYFRAFTSDGDELAKLDSSGVLTTIDVNPGVGANSFAGVNGGFTAFDGSLYFAANTAAAGLDLFKLDSAGTVTSLDLRPGANSSYAGEDGGFFVFQNNLYFNAYDDTLGEVLFRMSPNGGAPTAVRDASNNTVNHNSTVAANFHIFDGSLYFTDATPAFSDTLFKVGDDGVATALTYLGQALGGAGQFGGFAEFNGDLYFAATTATTNTDLFQDGFGGRDHGARPHEQRRVQRLRRQPRERLFRVQRLALFRRL